MCSFAYVTAGFSLLFSILLALGAVPTLRAARKAPTTSFLPGEAGSVAAFAAFWWMAAAVTFTQRGAQATDAGMPAASARNGVIALSWLEFAAFVVATVAVALDRCAGSSLLPPRDVTRRLSACKQLLGQHCSGQPAASTAFWSIGLIGSWDLHSGAADYRSLLVLQPADTAIAPGS